MYNNSPTPIIFDIVDSVGDKREVHMGAWQSITGLTKETRDHLVRVLDNDPDMSLFVRFSPVYEEVPEEKANWLKEGF